MPHLRRMTLSLAERTQGLRVHRQANKLPTIPLETYAQVSINHIVTGLTDVGDDAKVGWGVGIFPVSIEEMYAALNEEVQHVPSSPVNVTEVIQGTACTNGRVVFMNLPIPMLSDRWWVTTQGTSPEIRRVSQGQMAELTWNTIPNFTVSNLPSHLQHHTVDGVHVQESSGGWLLIKSTTRTPSVNTILGLTQTGISPQALQALSVHRVLNEYLILCCNMHKRTQKSVLTRGDYHSTVNHCPVLKET